MSKDLDFKTGLVVMVDALGSRNLTKERIGEFVEFKNELNDEWELLFGKASPGLMMMDKVDMNGNRIHVVFKAPSLFTLGDTFIFCLEKPVEVSRSEFIGNLTPWLWKIIPFGLRKGFFLRGSVSFGEYFVDDDGKTILGEAISDAANWFEEGDWIGIIATPRTSLMLFETSCKNKYQAGVIFHQYPIPLKSGKSIELFSVAWPYYYQIYEFDEIGVKIQKANRGDGDAIEFMNAFSENVKKQSLLTMDERKKMFLQQLAKHPIPKGSESKYFNTLKFFNAIWDIAGRDRVAEAPRS